MKPKKIIIGASMLVLLISGCKKYEDGPLISFRSPEKRLWGRYHAEVFTINGQDALQLWKDSICSNYLTLYIESSTYTRFIALDSYSVRIFGNYSLSENNTIIAFSIFGNNSTYKGFKPFAANDITSWSIIKLTNKQLHIKTNLNGTDYVLKLNKYMNEPT